LPDDCCVHAANSDATRQFPETYFDMVRVGIQSYTECVSLEAKVLQVRTVKPGEGVGYDYDFVAQKTTRIATVSMGYEDGIPRRFNGEVLIQGRRHSVVGHVCMDMCMVDVGDTSVQVGDKVTFCGEQRGETITLQEFADASGRITYESLCAIGDRVERVYY
jgi:alanine racemase